MTSTKTQLYPTVLKAVGRVLLVTAVKLPSFLVRLSLYKELSADMTLVNDLHYNHTKKYTELRMHVYKAWTRIHGPPLWTQYMTMYMDP